MKNLCCIIVLSLLGNTNVFSQRTDLIAYLEEQAHLLLRSKDLNIRKDAFKTIDSTLTHELIAEGNIGFLRENIDGYSIVRSEDGRLSIITFQLYVDVDEYIFGGFIIDYTTGIVSKLYDTSDQHSLDDVEYLLGNPNDWYGVVYLDIHQISANKYLLIGFDQFSLFERRKIVDFVSIGETGFLFGDPVFGGKNESVRNRKFRFIYTYAAQASAMLKYFSDSRSIIFDHLQPVKSNIKEQEIMMVPDGSFSGYILTDEGFFDYEDSILFPQDN